MLLGCVNPSLCVHAESGIACWPRQRVRSRTPSCLSFTPVTCSRKLYVAAVIDWYSRYVICWRLSNTLDGSFCLEMLDEALRQGRPEVFNTDQGAQFTA